MKKIRLVLFSLISLSLFSCASKEAAQIEDALAAAEAAGITQYDISNALEAAKTLSENEESTSSEGTENTSSENTNTDNSILAETSLQPETLSPTEKLIVENPEPLPAIEEPEVITLPPEEEPVKVTVVNEPEIVEEKIEDDAIAEADAVKVNAKELNTTEINAPELNTPEVTAAVEDVIDIEAEENAQTSDTQIAQTEENSQAKEPAPKPIVPSRSVTLKKLEYLDITYPGNGWIYMGITDGSKDLTYFGRKVGTKNTKFSVQAKLPGTKILHFYKNDTLTNTFIDDYIEVVVLDEKGSNKTHIAAPEYKTPVTVVLEKPVVEEKAIVEEETVESKAVVEEKPVKSKTVESKPVESKPVEKSIEDSPIVKKTIETEPAESEPLISNDDEVTDIIEIDTASLLKEIKDLFKAKKYKDALDKLEIFMENSTDKRDEALFYQGQIYEAKSEMQNIQSAINAYTTLTKSYPASKYWDDANKRIIYLKRFYLEGR